MRLHRKKSLLLCVLCAVVILARPALAADAYVVPLTQWGQPDLQGVWNFSSDVPMQRPEAMGNRQLLTEEEIAAGKAPQLQVLGGRRAIRSSTGIEAFYNDSIWAENRGGDDNIRTSLIVYPDNGRLPKLSPGIEYKPGGERDTAGQRPVRFSVGGIGRSGPEDRGLSERCLVGFNTGPQLMPSVYNNNVQIIQNRDHVVILSEMVHDARIVKLVDGGKLDEKVVLWSGDSRGHWEGDTLVVVTSHFNGQTQSFEGYGSARDKILTERLTRVGPLTIDYEFTISDPGTFTDVIVATLALQKVPTQLYEYACHEGNYGMANMLRAARAKDANREIDRVADLFGR